MLRLDVTIRDVSNFSDGNRHLTLCDLASLLRLCGSFMGQVFQTSIRRTRCSSECRIASAGLLARARS